MKASKMLTVAAAAIAAAAILPHASAQLSKAPVGDLVLEDMTAEERALMSVVVTFEECIGKTVPACEAIVAAEFYKQPNLFEANSVSDIVFEERPIRHVSATDYYMIGLRTNPEETHVVGVLGDGMVFYRWEWCTEAEECFILGPWDCDVGTPLTVAQCCNVIKASVPLPDIHNNYVDCYIDPPIGSTSNPVLHDRVIMNTDTRGLIVVAPINE